jgi:D-glycero-D-manno-heptose 1,7-bisphosphate phosphatase
VRPPRRAVFLDRDGVINRSIIRNGKPYPPATVEEVELLPRVDEALEAMKRAGFVTLVVTNQPDVARGKQRREVVEEINAFLMSRLPIDDVLVCYHDDGDGCLCRKPLPGLLLMGAEQYDIDLAESFMVGDRWRDVEAGNEAGCRTALIDYGYAERKPKTPPDVIVQSLYDATAWILGQFRTKER